MPHTAAGCGKHRAFCQPTGSAIGWARGPRLRYMSSTSPASFQVRSRIYKYVYKARNLSLLSVQHCGASGAAIRKKIRPQSGDMHVLQSCWSIT